MTAKEIVEALLYINPDTEKYFKAAHIIAEERPWKAKPHPEYPFIKAFKDPRFIVFISKQIHVYIIGDIAKGKSYNIINIEGFSANHLTLSKGNLTNLIKETITEPLYLPNNNMDRIIYMFHEELFIFNRMEMKSKSSLFSKCEWSIGVNIYDVNNRTYKISALDILKAIYSEF